MPLYDIEYVTPLTLHTQQELAIAFTQLHVKRFKTPASFINVRFTDASGQVVFRGGKRRYYNRAILRTRASENRSKAEYGEHCRDMVKVWDDMLCDGANEDITSTKRLRTVWILGALTTALEMGIQRPDVGEEAQWLERNHEEFNRLAEAGDEDMQEIVRSIMQKTS